MTNRRGEQAERSQLIDIAAMAALVKPQARPVPPPTAPRSELGPSFAASRLTTHVVEQPLASPPSRTRDPRAPLYWMIACLNVVVLALAAYVVFEEPPVVVRAAAVEAPVADATPDVVEPERRVEVAHVAAPVEIPGAPEIDAPADPEPESHRRRASRPRTRPAREPAAAPAKKPAREVASSAPASKDLPIECIVDPASCDRGRKQPTTAAQGPRTRAPAEDLPATLSQSALRTGFGRVRAQAKACGPTHGAAPGEQVAVKISIAGTTGSITAAKPLGTHAGTPLGSCVASALRGATFERFAKSQIGLKYTVRL